MMLLLRLGQTSYHSDGEPRWEREGERRGRKGTKGRVAEEVGMLKREEGERGCKI